MEAVTHTPSFVTEGEETVAVPMAVATKEPEGVEVVVFDVVFPVAFVFGAAGVVALVAWVGGVGGGARSGAKVTKGTTDGAMDEPARPL